jgi:hypothetical protein
MPMPTQKCFGQMLITAFICNAFKRLQKFLNNFEKIVPVSFCPDEENLTTDECG